MKYEYMKYMKYENDMSQDLLTWDLNDVKSLVMMV